MQCFLVVASLVLELAPLDTNVSEKTLDIASRTKSKILEQFYLDFKSVVS